MLIQRSDISFNSSQSEFSLDLNLSDDQSENFNITSHPISKRLWSNLRSNKTSVHLHVVIYHDLLHQVDEISKEMLRDGAALFGSVELVKYDKIPKHFSYRYLLSDIGLVNPDNLDGS